MNSNETFRSADFGCLAGLIAILAGIGVWTPILPPTMPQDNLQYLAIARDLSAYFEVPGIYAQRVVPCAIVWGLDRAGLCDVVQGFTVVSYVAIGTFLVGLYVSFRRAGLSPIIATTASLYSLIGSWPIVYCLSNVYQACDALAYPLGLAYCLAVKSNRCRRAVLIGTLGLGCRQQLLVLVILGGLAQFWTTRQRRWLVATCVHLLLFSLLVATAGQHGAAGVIEHTVARLSAWPLAARGLYESRLPLLLSPYGLVLLVHLRVTWTYLRRYWWVAGYSLVTALQPLFAYDITGPENAARLAMPGLWPAVFLGGLLVGRNVQSTGWAVAFAVSPLLYGTSHLVSFSAGWPSPMGHRAFANVVIAAISIAAYLARSRRGADFQ